MGWESKRKKREPVAYTGRQQLTLKHFDGKKRKPMPGNTPGFFLYSSLMSRSLLFGLSVRFGAPGTISTFVI